MNNGTFRDDSIVLLSLLNQSLIEFAPQTTYLPVTFLW